MATIYTRAEIESAIQPADVIAAMERALVEYSQGEAVVPPVGQMDFEDPPGDCHIKFGYLKKADTFTVKIATGFWRNVERGLPSSNGVVLIFSKLTGELLAILPDEGYLTDIQTAAAGAVAAKFLAPANLSVIGILGAGTQSRLQLKYLKEVTDCRRVLLWARTLERALCVQVDGFSINIAPSIDALTREARLIVTTTSSRKWLLSAVDIWPGTHITAVGADGGGKQELEPALFRKAAICAVDSRRQCLLSGDSSFASSQGLIRAERFIELGEMIANPSLGRRTQDEITIADLTGVAVQDIAAAQLALNHLEGRKSNGVHQRRANPGQRSR